MSSEKASSRWRIKVDWDVNFDKSAIYSQIFLSCTLGYYFFSIVSDVSDDWGDNEIKFKKLLLYLKDVTFWCAKCLLKWVIFLFESFADNNN